MRGGRDGRRNVLLAVELDDHPVLRQLLLHQDHLHAATTAPPTAPPTAPKRIDRVKNDKWKGTTRSVLRQEGVHTRHKRHTKTVRRFVQTSISTHGSYQANKDPPTPKENAFQSSSAMSVQTALRLTILTAVEGTLPPNKPAATKHTPPRYIQQCLPAKVVIQGR